MDEQIKAFLNTANEGKLLSLLSLLEHEEDMSDAVELVRFILLHKFNITK